MENMKKINDELTVSGQVTAEQLYEVANEGFKSVMNLRSPDEKGFLTDEEQQAKALGLHYVNIPVKVDTLTEEQTTKILKEIDELPKPALIHCGTTMRAGAMSLMNVATRQEMTPEQAFEKAGEIGFDCSSNPKMKEFFAQYVSKNAWNCSSSLIAQVS
ncbi:protein tyrosine phosphatase family protein [Chlorogloeopsis sp. ULAP01]|uniref:protein tyrosine phosphatase family protein n=1 Tax=Chlorogloeopsis sp. ULAP01 TaxID=3056483 RepID=UPI0025AA39AC|nr:protein tyrosine phosphatase family protein [Chlorogloeopsis sp. ULAP01]MDM9382455.1 protein tyrosine phosphatase family protein [Chlorogloeopsis sp. ULAP01]